MLEKGARNSGPFFVSIGGIGMRTLARGRVAKWSREKVDALSTPELRQLLANAERLKEAEVAALCNELLGERPRGHATVRRHRPKGARGLVTRAKAFEMHGVSLRSRIWSRGGVRSGDGAVVVTVPAEEVQNAEGAKSYLLWAPNVAGSRPWSDKPGGQERLEHCRLALERGEAQGLLVYGKRPEESPPEEKAPGADGVDAETVLNLRVEKRGEEYWATWTEEKRPTVKSIG